MAGEARTAKAAYEATTLAASAIVFVFDQALAGSAVDDTCDVFVQTKIDGANWVDVVHFTQRLGNGTDALRSVAKIRASAAMTEFENATALGAAAVRDLIGDEWAVRWVIVTGAGTHSF